QLASRHSRLSAAIRESSNAKATQMFCAPPPRPDSVSTRNLTPYWVLTEHVTAASTAAKITACVPGRYRMARTKEPTGLWAYAQRESILPRLRQCAHVDQRCLSRQRGPSYPGFNAIPPSWLRTAARRTSGLGNLNGVARLDMRGGHSFSSLTE